MYFEIFVLKYSLGILLLTEMISNHMFMTHTSPELAACSSAIPQGSECWAQLPGSEDLYPSGRALLTHELKDLIRCHVVQPWESILSSSLSRLVVPACSPSLGIKLVLPCSSGSTHQHHLTRALAVETGARTERWGFCPWVLMCQLLC